MRTLGNGARRGAIAIICAAVLVTAAACGGGSAGAKDESGTSTTTTGSTTTTTEATTTTAAPRPAADAATTLLAGAATLQPDDFPAGWTVHREGRRRELTPESCSYRADGPEARLGAGAVQDGPTMQLGDRDGSITSSGYAFATEEDAVAFVETVRSGEWAECKQKELGDLRAERDTGVAVRLNTREIEQVGTGGFESYAEFYGRDADDDVVLVVNVMHYRLGRVVIEDTLERATSLSDADWAAVDAAHAQAVAKVWARLNDLPTS